MTTMKRTLIQSATIISMDDRIGDLRTGDVLVENGRIAEVRPGIALYGSQMALSVAWAMLFFGLRRPALSLVTAAALWVAIALTITEFARRHRFAALMLFPYLAWATYAAATNLAAWHLHTAAGRRR